MQSVLNFGQEQFPKLKKIFTEKEKINNTTPYHEIRVKIGESTLTLYKSGMLVIQGKDHDEVKNTLLSEMSLEKELMIGFDEVGRGEDFGPLVVTGVLGDKNNLRELRDSKKISKISEKFVIATKNSLANVSVSFNAEFIDSLRNSGINLNKIEGIAVKKIIEMFEELKQKQKVIVDGSVHLFSKENVEFIAKADDTEPVVGAASVIAKFQREQSGDLSKRKSWNKKEKN